MWLLVNTDLKETAMEFRSFRDLANHHFKTRDKRGCLKRPVEPEPVAKPIVTKGLLNPGGMNDIVTEVQRLDDELRATRKGGERTKLISQKRQLLNEYADLMREAAVENPRHPVSL
jgi:hypothetical protein